ncbi:hypothetical protein [uncultured Mediterranean phage uvDeep-CGR2-AD3-C191]|nr:hypothetical protein [uncultured Mediterranean phage uvDeep-CGR2-AD3-C191]
MKNYLTLLLLLSFPGTALSAEFYYCLESKASGFRVTKEKKFVPSSFRGRKFNMLLDKQHKTVLLTWPYVVSDPAPVKSGAGITELYSCRTPMAYKKRMFDCSGAATTSFSGFAFNPENGRFMRTRHFGNLANEGTSKWKTRMEDSYVAYGTCERFK